jgi:hypothetical protein
MEDGIIGARIINGTRAAHKRNVGSELRKLVEEVSGGNEDCSS